MKDQALKLREIAYERKSAFQGGVPNLVGVETAPAPRTIAVTSGKGGVGKTSLSINLGLALAAQGKRVILLDADLGLANINVALGLRARYTIQDVMTGQRAGGKCCLKVETAGIRVHIQHLSGKVKTRHLF